MYIKLDQFYERPMTDAEKVRFRFLSVGSVLILVFSFFPIFSRLCLAINSMGDFEFMESIRSFFSTNSSNFELSLFGVAALTVPTFLIFLPILYGRIGASISTTMLGISGKITDKSHSKHGSEVKVQGIWWFVPWKFYTEVSENDSVLLLRPKIYRNQYITDAMKLEDNEVYLKGFTLVSDSESSSVKLIETIRNIIKNIYATVLVAILVLIIIFMIGVAFK